MVDLFDDERGPELGPILVDPHDYQVEGFTKVTMGMDRGDPSMLCVMPTGTGKTILALLVARYVVEDLGGRVLFLAHTDELIRQACNTSPAVGMSPEVEKGDQHARPDLTLYRDAPPSMFGGNTLDPKFVVASVATLKGSRLKCWPKGHFSLVITDECHHAFAVTYRNIIEHLEPRWHLGLTATPDRGDGEPIVGPGQVFETKAFEYSLWDAVERGFLKRPWYECLNCEVDLSALRPKNAKDYSDAEIENALLPHVTEIVNELRPKLMDKRAVIFTPLVKSADAIASALCSLGVSAECIYGDHPDRAGVISDFKSGRYRHLVNAQVLTEGFDAPFVNAAVVLRATKSRGLFTQMAGRCLRRNPPETEGTIYGVNWKTFGHKLVKPVELFAKDADAETVALAGEATDGAERADLMLALKRAAAEKRERERVRMEVEERKAKARSVRFDPMAFDPEFMPSVEAVSAARWEAPATEKQVAALERAGFDPAEVAAWTKGRASGTLSKLADRRERGLATYKQVKWLKKLGVPDAAKLTKEQATAELDRRFNGGRAAG